VAIDEITKQACQLDCEHGFPVTHDLLHQHAVDELEETALAGTNLDYVFFGGCSKWRIAANPPG
jgi:hypothetical protein